MRDYEDLVKSLRYCAEYDCTTVCPRAGTGNGCITRLKKEAADAIEELSKSKWISAEKRLPEVGKRVLTLSKFGHCFDRTLREHNGGVLLFAPDGFAPGKDVTHWMPLPEPPEGES